LGTCAVGRGATLRQPSLRTRAGTVAGRATPVPSTALEIAATNVGFDWLEFSCSADAQQLSASAWVMRRCDPELSERPLCMGHASSKQQAMRSSGVCAQPAHTAGLPAERRMVRASANSRLLRISTSLACRTERQVSNRFQSSRYFPSELTDANPSLRRFGDRLQPQRPSRTENRLERLLSRQSQATKSTPSSESYSRSERNHTARLRRD